MHHEPEPHVAHAMDLPLGGAALVATPGGDVGGHAGGEPVTPWWMPLAGLAVFLAGGALWAVTPSAPPPHVLTWPKDVVAEAPRPAAAAQVPAPAPVAPPAPNEGGRAAVSAPRQGG